MNSYGHQAMRRWAQTDPERYAAIEDPASFFADLGEQVELTGSAASMSG